MTALITSSLRKCGLEVLLSSIKPVNWFVFVISFEFGTSSKCKQQQIPGDVNKRKREINHSNRCTRLFDDFLTFLWLIQNAYETFSSDLPPARKSEKRKNGHLKWRNFDTSSSVYFCYFCVWRLNFKNWLEFNLEL